MDKTIALQLTLYNFLCKYRYYHSTVRASSYVERIRQKFSIFSKPLEQEPRHENKRNFVVLQYIADHTPF